MKYDTTKTRLKARPVTCLLHCMMVCRHAAAGTWWEVPTKIIKLLIQRLVFETEDLSGSETSLTVTTHDASRRRHTEIVYAWEDGSLRCLCVPHTASVPPHVHWYDTIVYLVCPFGFGINSILCVSYFVLILQSVWLRQERRCMLYVDCFGLRVWPGWWQSLVMCCALFF